MVEKNSNVNIEFLNDFPTLQLFKKSLVGGDGGRTSCLFPQTDDGRRDFLVVIFTPTRKKRMDHHTYIQRT